MIDIVLALEWTRSSDLELTMEFLQSTHALVSKNQLARIGIILYGKEPCPILDLVEANKINKLLGEIPNIPLLQHPAEPALAFYEAIEMIEELYDHISSRKVVLLTASFSSRPKILLEDAIVYARSINGLNYYIFTTSNRRPRWLSNNIAKEVSILRRGASIRYLRKII